jgi:hypothetical protein
VLQCELLIWRQNCFSETSASTKGDPSVIGPNQLVIPVRIETINVSALDTNLLGHSYYGDNTSVISDLYYLLGQDPWPRSVFGCRSKTQQTAPIGALCNESRV